MPPTVRHTPAFTYNDFVHAMTDKPWYFSIFLERAKSIARNLGVRSDYQEDYAMEAIAHMNKILAQYNPSRSKFSSYFDTCVGNKIKDCNEARQSDIVFGADRSGRESVDERHETLSDEYGERRLRQRRYADSMEDEFRKFIDKLTPDERMIFYASEFGQSIFDEKEREDYLRQNIGEVPDGRSYSRLIAARIGRTDAAVRQAAKRLKEDAKVYIKERGFDYGSYSTYMGYMTTRPAEGKQDFTSLDWSALSGVQRLRLRMYLYEKALADGMALEEAPDHDDDVTSSVMSAYEEGKLAAAGTVAAVLKRIMAAQENMRRSREEKDLVSFVYWFVLVHEYDCLLRELPTPEQVQEAFEEIDRFSPLEYLAHKRRNGYSRLPDFHTVYGRGYNFPDIIGCALSGRCAEEILTFEPRIESI